MNDKKRILVIGASACGAKTASRIKRIRPDYEVTILDQGQYISFAACGIPQYLSGKIRDVQYFKDLKDITIHTNVKVGSISIGSGCLGHRSQCCIKYEIWHTEANNSQDVFSRGGSRWEQEDLIPKNQWSVH